MRTNRSMPDGTVIPVLAYAEAAEWLCRVFGFELRWRAGDHRAQVGVGGGSAVALAQGTPGADDSVMVRVEAVDAHHARVVAAGAEILFPPTDYPYGERQYTAADLAGRRWTFSETIADVAPGNWGG